MLKNFFNKCHLFRFLFSFLGITLIFAGGFFSSNTRLEKISEYATKVAVEHTKNGKICALTVEKTKESGPLPDSTTEFYNLYGTFKQEKITFASAINADKRHNITINNISDNLSFLYAGPSGTIKYNGHYKHFVLPIETMFGGVDVSSVSDYAAYISETHANKMLENLGVLKKDGDKYTGNDYESLIKQPLKINIDGTEYTFGICNIYYQQNYYYEGVSETIGDFIMVSYYLPNNLRTEQQNIYFMSNYTYQNKYFMNHINNVYSSKKYSLKVNPYNIVGEIDEELLTSFYYSSSIRSLDWLNIVFIVHGILFLALSLLCFFATLESTSKLSCFINIVWLFSPYILFSLLFILTGNVCFLSEVSCKVNAFCVLTYLTVILILFKFKEKIVKTVFFLRSDSYHEISI